MRPAGCQEAERGARAARDLLQAEAGEVVLGFLEELIGEAELVLVHRFGAELGENDERASEENASEIRMPCARFMGTR